MAGAPTLQLVAPTPTEPSLRRRLVSHIDNLPVLPLAIANLMALDPNDDDYFDDVVHILETEPNFAARVLTVANSATSAPTRPVTTLPGAVARIGSRSATNLVLAVSVTKVFVPRDPWERSLWRHGVQVAHAARLLAGHVTDDARINSEEVYTCALLHDVGRFVFFQEAPDKLRTIDEGDWDTPEALVEQELAVCGLTHPEVGAMACAKWGLPEVIEQTVRQHHKRLPETISTATEKVIALVRLADFAMFPSTMPGTESLDESLDADEMAAFLESHQPAFLSLSGAQMKEILRQARIDADEACQLLGIAE